MESCAVEPRCSPFSIAAGDLCAARDLAVELLGRVASDSTRLFEARMLLTAACLHLSAGAGPDPTQAQATLLVTTLANGDRDVWRKLAVSPLPFVRYVAIEFCDGVDAAIAELVVRAVRSLQT